MWMVSVNFNHILILKKKIIQEEFQQYFIFPYTVLEYTVLLRLNAPVNQRTYDLL